MLSPADRVMDGPTTLIKASITASSSTTEAGHSRELFDANRVCVRLRVANSKHFPRWSNPLLKRKIWRPPVLCHSSAGNSGGSARSLHSIDILGKAGNGQPRFLGCDRLLCVFVMLPNCGDILARWSGSSCLRRCPVGWSVQSAKVRGSHAGPCRSMSAWWRLESAESRA